MRGPEAGVILGLEVGLHRFRGFDGKYDPAAMPTPDDERGDDKPA